LQVTSKTERYSIGFLFFFFFVAGLLGHDVILATNKLNLITFSYRIWSLADFRQKLFQCFDLMFYKLIRKCEVIWSWVRVFSMSNFFYFFFLFLTKLVLYRIIWIRKNIKSIMREVCYLYFNIGELKYKKQPDLVRFLYVKARKHWVLNWIGMKSLLQRSSWPQLNSGYTLSRKS
jgi:hypothetical protein